jgi:hypothetical protein
MAAPALVDATIALMAAPALVDATIALMAAPALADATIALMAAPALADATIALMAAPALADATIALHPDGGTSSILASTGGGSAPLPDTAAATLVDPVPPRAGPGHGPSALAIALPGAHSGPGAARAGRLAPARAGRLGRETPRGLGWERRVPGTGDEVLPRSILLPLHAACRVRLGGGATH